MFTPILNKVFYTYYTSNITLINDKKNLFMVKNAVVI